MTRAHKSTHGCLHLIKDKRFCLKCTQFWLQMSAVADIADDYIHISATLNSICAEDSTANKKWV